MTPASVTFWGAAQTVTGSMHLVEFGGRKLLLDCGSHRGGSRDEARSRNRHFPFRPSEISAVVLSHAHADHCGNLPELIHQGFAGPIFCTPPTRDLVEVMLADSAKFREEDLRVARITRGAARRDEDDELDEGDGLSVLNEPAPRELAARAAMQCLPVPYGRDTEVLPGVTLRFANAGHILGSAMTHLTFHGQGPPRSLVFTGDLGRRGVPYLWPAAPVPEADLIVCESTYGGRFHPTLDQMAESMAAVVRRVAAEGGKVLVPAFSLGRTQLVVHYLHRWMADGVMPRLPIFVDGPLAAAIADIYRDHAGDLVDPKAYPLDGAGEDVTHVRLLEESRELTQRRGPCVIVASSGMCDGGRILYHLKQNIDDPRAGVVLVSYQAPGTLGAKLLEPRPTVRFHGRDWNLWAEVHKLDGFSGHAGHDDVLAYLKPLVRPGRKVRLVHGEPEPARALASALRELGFEDVAVPAPGDRVNV